MTNVGQRAGCAAAFSQHPDAAVAVGEVIGDILERLEPHPDLAVLLIAGSLAEHSEQIVAAVSAIVAPETLIGSTALAVFGGLQDGTGAGGIALWAANGRHVLPFHLTVDGRGRPDLVPSAAEAGTVALLLGERSFPFELLASDCSQRSDLSALVGGLAWPAGGGKTTLIEGAGLQTELHDHGAVGVLIPPTLAQVFGFEVRIWEEDDPIPPPPIHPAGGDGALLFAGRRVDLFASNSLDLEVVFERFSGGVAGMIGQAVSFPQTAASAGADQRVAALIFG